MLVPTVTTGRSWPLVGRVDMPASYDSMYDHPAWGEFRREYTKLGPKVCEWCSKGPDDGVQLDLNHLRYNLRFKRGDVRRLLVHPKWVRWACHSTEDGGCGLHARITQLHQTKGEKGTLTHAEARLVALAEFRAAETSLGRLSRWKADVWAQVLSERWLVRTGRVVLAGLALSLALAWTTPVVWGAAAWVWSGVAWMLAVAYLRSPRRRRLLLQMVRKLAIVLVLLALIPLGLVWLFTSVSFNLDLPALAAWAYQSSDQWARNLLWPWGPVMAAIGFAARLAWKSIKR